MSEKTKISFIIMTHNEELNIEHALKSVAPWADEIFLVDSGSADRTLELARRYTDKIYHHAFGGFGHQINWAFDNLPIKNEWIYILDADEQITPALRDEIRSIVNADPQRKENGFYVAFKFIFMGKWIKRASSYPIWIIRMIRKGYARREVHWTNPHMMVNGEVGYLKNPMLHEDHKGLTEWIAKHNVYATKEAEEFLKQNKGDYIPMRFFGTQAERKRFIRYKIWPYLPARSLLYFFYLYIFKRGFLDGLAGFHFSALKAFAFYLIELKIKEKKLPGASPRGEGDKK